MDVLKKALLTLGLSCLSSIALASGQQELAAPVMEINTPHIEASLTQDNANSVFMKIKNNGNSTHNIIAAYSPVAKEVQLHTTKVRHHHPLMKQISAIKIKPHKDQDLHQGGLHVMLIDLIKPLKPKQKIPVTLIFRDGSWLTVEAVVS